MQPITDHGGNTVRSHKHIGLDTFAALQYRGRIIETRAARTGSYRSWGQRIEQDFLQNCAMDADARRTGQTADSAKFVFGKETSRGRLDQVALNN